VGLEVARQGERASGKGGDLERERESWEVVLRRGRGWRGRRGRVCGSARGGEHTRGADPSAGWTIGMLVTMVHSAGAVEEAEHVHIASWWLRRWLWRLRNAALDGEEVLRFFRRQRAAEEAASATARSGRRRRAAEGEEAAAALGWQQAAGNTLWRPRGASSGQQRDSFSAATTAPPDSVSSAPPRTTRSSTAIGTGSPCGTAIELQAVRGGHWTGRSVCCRRIL